MSNSNPSTGINAWLRQTEQQTSMDAFFGLDRSNPLTFASPPWTRSYRLRRWLCASLCRLLRVGPYDL